LIDLLSPNEWQALVLTLQVAARAVGFGLPLAIMVAVLLSRPQFPGRIILNTFVQLPLALPSVVVGWLLLLIFGLRAPVGAFLFENFGVRLVFSSAGAALACATMSFPLMVRTLRVALEAIDPGLIQAAQSLGANKLDCLFSIILPIALPGVVVAAIVGFAACLGEFGAVITFAANIPGETQTLPLAVYSALQTPDGERAATRLSLISVALAGVGLISAEIVARRFRERVGR
jgi:molybdate transport system permease protein